MGRSNSKGSKGFFFYYNEKVGIRHFRGYNVFKNKTKSELILRIQITNLSIVSPSLIIPSGLSKVTIGPKLEYKLLKA